MRFVRIETLQRGMALVDLDKVSHALSLETGCRLHLGNETLDIPHSLQELENVLAGRDRGDDGATSVAGFGRASGA